MGLDNVELVLALEDHFGIRLPDDRLYPETVGGLFDAVRTQWHRSDERAKAGHCRCIPVFFEVRDALLAVNPNASRIRPSTRLDELLPARRLRRLWNELNPYLYHRLPLLPSPREGGAVMLAWLGVMLIAILLGGLAFGEGGVILVAVLFTPIATLLATAVYNRLRRDLPLGMSTVRDLVHAVMPPKRRESGPATDEHLWQRYVSIVSDQLDVPIEEIRRESHFVRDLKCG